MLSSARYRPADPSPRKLGRPTSLPIPRYEHVGTGSALGKKQVSMLLDDELAAHGIMNSTPSHPPISARKKNSPVLCVQRKAKENQRGEREMTPGSDRLARGTCGLHDVVFKEL